MTCFTASALGDGDAAHLHRRLRIVAFVRRCVLDGVHDVHTLDDVGEHRVLGVPGGEPVEVAVVHCVHEELRAARVGAILAKMKEIVESRIGRKISEEDIIVVTCPAYFNDGQRAILYAVGKNGIDDGGYKDDRDCDQERDDIIYWERNLEE